MISTVIGALVLGVVIAAELLARLVSQRHWGSLWCRCMHLREMHRHYSGLTHCSKCGCGRFRPGPYVSRETSRDWGSA